MKHLKILGLALMAMLAMSVVVTSAASAVEFHAESSPTTLTGEQKPGTSDLFTTMGGTTTCSTITYVGSMSRTSSWEAEVVPSYEHCIAFGFLNVPIDVNGCKYKFTAPFDSLHIVCPEGKAIEVTSPGCTITVGTQTPTGGTLTYTNLGSGATREIGVDTSLSGIHYIEDNKGLFPTCKSPGVTTTDGTYSGQSVFKGENESGIQHGIWVE